MPRTGPHHESNAISCPSVGHSERVEHALCRTEGKKLTTVQQKASTADQQRGDGSQHQQFLYRTGCAPTILEGVQGVGNRYLAKIL